MDSKDIDGYNRASQREKERERDDSSWPDIEWNHLHGNATARAVCPWLSAATANHTRIREILLTCTNRYLTIRSISAFPEC